MIEYRFGLCVPFCTWAFLSPSPLIFFGGQCAFPGRGVRHVPKIDFKIIIQMISLTGSPQTAARQLIAHLKATGRWPEEDGESQRPYRFKRSTI